VWVPLPDGAVLVPEPCDTGDENNDDEDAETLRLVEVECEDGADVVLGADGAEELGREELIPTEVEVVEAGTLVAEVVEAKFIPFPMLVSEVHSDDEGIG